MKNYKITIIDKKSGNFLENFTELSKTKKFLQKKYESKYKFSYPGSKINIERLIRKPGVQVDLFDLIKESEASNG